VGAFTTPTTATGSTFINTLIRSNSVAQNGGGIYHSAGATPLQLFHATLMGNEALEAGGLYNAQVGLRVDSSIFYNNTALLGDYGAIWSVPPATPAEEATIFLFYNNFFGNTGNSADPSNIGVGLKS
jgi:hypothetical protein